MNLVQSASVQDNETKKKKKTKTLQYNLTIEIIRKALNYLLCE